VDFSDIGPVASSLDSRNGSMAAGNEPPIHSTPDSYPVPGPDFAHDPAGEAAGDAGGGVNTEPFTDDPTVVEHHQPGGAAGDDSSTLRYSQQEGPASPGTNDSAGLNTSASSRSPHMTPRDMERVAVITAYANGVGFCCSRVLGSIPGPIVLAALIDDESVDIGVAFTIVGLVAGVVASVTAALAYWSVCPCHSSVVDGDDEY